jgi:hypothetical protein
VGIDTLIPGEDQLAINVQTRDDVTDLRTFYGIVAQGQGSSARNVPPGAAGAAGLAKSSRRRRSKDGAVA